MGESGLKWGIPLRGGGGGPLGTGRGDVVELSTLESVSESVGEW